MVSRFFLPTTSALGRAALTATNCKHRLLVIFIGKKLQSRKLTQVASGLRQAAVQVIRPFTILVCLYPSLCCGSGTIFPTDLNQQVLLISGPTGIVLERPLGRASRPLAFRVVFDDWGVLINRHRPGRSCTSKPTNQTR